jgi:hypothetical protein
LLLERRLRRADPGERPNAARGNEPAAFANMGNGRPCGGGSMRASCQVQAMLACQGRQYAHSSFAGYRPAVVGLGIWVLHRCGGIEVG